MTAPRPAPPWSDPGAPMTYERAHAYLAALEPHRIRPGLERIGALLARLGDPQAALRSVLIAGTNGKGSVAAFVAAIVKRAGLVPGVYTSPHLVSFEERIVVGDDPISASEVAALTGLVRDAIEAEARTGGDRPTYFEATTAMAFLHFRRREVPLAILEVGMGGRFDATNVVTPLACGITSIALDHMEWLGKTIGAIARQKAGILRAGVPAAAGLQPRAALKVLRAEAGRVGAPLTLTADCGIRPAGPAGAPPRDPPVFSLTTPSGGRYPLLAPALRGAHQIDNAAVAVLIAERLAAARVGSIDGQAIASGLATAVWPGRLELIPGRPGLLLDGAHNPAGCRTLADYLAQHHAGRRVVLLFAAMHDKPADAMLQILAPHAARIITTALPVARGETAAALRDVAARLHRDVAAIAPVGEALSEARRHAGEEGLVVASGSLYLVGEIKKTIAASLP